MELNVSAGNVVAGQLICLWQMRGEAGPFWRAYRWLHQPVRVPDARRDRLLDQACGQGQPGQVGSAAAPGLVPDPVQVRANGTDADGKLLRDLSVGAPLGDQGDQLPFPGTEPAQARLAGDWRTLGSSVSMRAYSAAVARLIAAPRSSAAQVRAGPGPDGLCARVLADGAHLRLIGIRLVSPASAAQTVMAPARRPVDGEQVPGTVQAVEEATWPPARDGDLQRFPQVCPGLGDAARSHVEVRQQPADSWFCMSPASLARASPFRSCARRRPARRRISQSGRQDVPA